MSISRKAEREMIRNEYLMKVIARFNDDGEQVLQVKSNEIAIPVVGCEGNEDFVVITVKVPTGANKGTEPYDGFSEAESYEMKVKEKEAKAKAAAEKRRKRLSVMKKSAKRKKKLQKRAPNRRLFLLYFDV